MSAPLKMECVSEACCVCGGGGGGGGALVSPEEHDAGAHHPVPLRAMLLHLNNDKVVPEGRLCAACIARVGDAYELSVSLGGRGAPLSDKIRALRRRLHELTQRIDVFIVVGGAGGAYTEDDVVVVERGALLAADLELERARGARGEPAFQCNVCPASFTRGAGARAHAATHAPGAPLTCWTCGAQFSEARALHHHAAEHGAPPACALCNRVHGEGGAACVPRCPACGVEAASRADLSAHCAAEHGRDATPPCVCPVCFRAVDSGELLAAHLVRHRQARRFVCGLEGCAVRCATRASLLQHVRDQHGEGAHPSHPHACAHCSRTFGSAAALKRHARVHRTQTEEGSGSEGDVEYLEVDALEH